MWELIVKGQWFMAPLLLCSVLAVAVMVERFAALRTARRESAAFLSRFDQLVQSHDLIGARELCRSTPGAMASMLLAGLDRYDDLRQQDSLSFLHEQVNRSIEDHGASAVAELETHLGMLASIGTIAPLLGFAGTVTGMIEAFDAIAQSNDINVTLVASGISEALITTAAGLLIAIPSIVAFNYFTRQVTELASAMEGSANGMLNQMLRWSMAGQAKVSRDQT